MSLQHCPTPTELDDLELLVSGAYAPISRFNEPGTPVTLALPDGATEAELVDPEGLPLATVAADGSITPLTHAQYGPFRRLHQRQGRFSAPNRLLGQRQNASVHLIFSDS